MPLCQRFVRQKPVARTLWLAGIAALALAVSSCGNSAQKAYQEGQRAQALLQAGDLPGAQKAITKALSYRDDQIDLLLLDAQIKYMMRDIPAAFEAYSTVLAMDSANPTALQAVAQLGMSSGHEAEAKVATQQILATDPNQPDALLMSGLQAINAKDYAAAAAAGAKLLGALPGDPRGVVLSARAAFLAGRRADAFAQLRAAAAKDPSNDLIATALLECARDQGDAPLMLKQLTLLRGAHPDSVDLTIDEANVRYKTGDLAGARTVGLDLIDKHGDDATALSRLYDLWVEYDSQPLGPEAVARIAADGKLEARLMVARYFLQARDLARAAEALGNASDDRANGLRARIRLAGGDAGGATLAEQVLGRDSTNCDALAARAEARLARRDPTAAVVAAQQIAAECPDRNDGFLLLARAYMQKGLRSGVERAFADGIALRPLDRPLSSAFADWQLSQNRSGVAIGIARRLTQIAPAKISAWQLLESTCRQGGDSYCAARASSQRAAAARNYAIDLPPGQRQVNPLLGQSWL